MTWLNNGQSVKLPVGNYKIIFSELEGFQTPQPIIVGIIKNQTTNVNVEYLPIQTSIIVGVQDIGTRSVDGAGLRHVVTSGDTLIESTELDTAFFDAHPSFQFEDDIFNTNHFVKIPISYWWRGMMPDTTDGITPRWTMLLSNAPVTWNGKEFTAQSAAFKHHQNGWMDQFYYGKYRGSAGYGSKPGATHLGNVSWTNWVSGCNALGNGHHFASIQEYFEIIGRMVIEKKTFQLFPKTVRGNQSLCKYRGVEDLAYGGAPVMYEWMNGLLTNASNIATLWDEAGGNYVTTGKAIGSANFIHSLQDGNLFDHLFLAKTVGAEATSFIPDYNFSLANCVCYMNFDPSYSHYGAFCASLGNSSTDTHSAVGGRVARW